jgi:lipid-A-disaccharide synthase-like uncharacterized protein
MELLFKFTGALGLIFIIIGVLVRDRKRQSILFIIGGLFLEIYSIYLRDPIFITLQGVFVVAAAYELYKLKRKS